MNLSFSLHTYIPYTYGTVQQFIVVIYECITDSTVTWLQRHSPPRRSCPATRDWWPRRRFWKVLVSTPSKLLPYFHYYGASRFSFVPRGIYCTVIQVIYITYSHSYSHTYSYIHTVDTLQAFLPIPHSLDDDRRVCMIHHAYIYMLYMLAARNPTESGHVSFPSLYVPCIPVQYCTRKACMLCICVCTTTTVCLLIAWLHDYDDACNAGGWCNQWMHDGMHDGMYVLSVHIRSQAGMLFATSYVRMDGRTADCTQRYQHADAVLCPQSMLRSDCMRHANTTNTF